MAFTQVIYRPSCCRALLPPLLLLLLLLLVRNIYALHLPPSPCPNVFAYEGDVESDRWRGVITFSSNIELVGMNYKVQLDRPSQLLVSWDGEVRSDDNANYNVFDPFHTQKGGEVVKARIMVKFNPNNGIPGISRIVINGNTMCNKDGNSGSGAFGVGFSEESTTRFDPSFNEGGDIASEFSNNRGGGHSTSNNYNYGASSPNYNGENNSPNFETRPSSNSHRPSYANEDGLYGGGGANSPANYNSANRAPSYSNGAAATSSPPAYVANPSSSSSSSSSNSAGSGSSNSGGSYVPGGGGGGGGGGVNSNGYPNNGGNEGAFAAGQGNYNNPAEYSNNNNRPAWPETSSSNSYNNRTGGGSWQNNGHSSNSPASSAGETNANGGPIVTTLTLPNANPNKTNVDQIVQIIKNQLEQQHISGATNKTVIVAVVNSMPNGGSQININTSATTTTDPPVVYRTTTTTPTSSTVSSKAKIVVSTAKSSGSNGHTSRPKD